MRHKHIILSIVALIVAAVAYYGPAGYWGP